MVTGQALAELDQMVFILKQMRVQFVSPLPLCFTEEQILAIEIDAGPAVWRDMRIAVNYIPPGKAFYVPEDWDIVFCYHGIVGCRKTTPYPYPELPLV